MRIKAMQHMYSYKISQKYYIDQVYKAYAQQKKDACAKHMYKDILSDITSSSSLKLPLNSEFQDIIKNYHQNIQKEKKKITQNLQEDSQRIQNIYYFILYLLHQFFVSKSKNCFIEGLRSNFFYLEKVKAIEKTVYWDVDNISYWYTTFFIKDKVIKKYLSCTVKDIHYDLEILFYTIKNIIFNQDAIEDFFFEIDIRWYENKIWVNDMLENTFTINKQKDSGITLQKSIVQQDFLIDFFHELIQTSLENECWLEEKIEKIAQNWSLSRMFILDKILIHLALNEMIAFASIPLRVTLDEYIQIAKKYSTEKSSLFINGILEKILILLQQEKKINKIL